MNLFIRFFKNFTERGLEYFKRYYGTYRAVCVDNKDPEKQGRILVKIPITTGNQTHPEWVWPIMPMGGKNKGTFWIPDPLDPVYVMFENGDPKYPMYMGGYWPKPKSGTYSMEDAYNDKGVPSKRIFRTKAGHELSFDDNEDDLSIKILWHDANKDLNSFITCTEDGSILMGTHNGNLINMQTKEDNEMIMIVDSNGNSIIQDKKGTKIIDNTGNLIELKENTIQAISSKNLILNSPSVNVDTSGMVVGSGASESSIKGTSWLSWWSSTVLIWLNTHTHPTGTGPSGPALTPMQAPQKKQLLTDILKVK